MNQVSHRKRWILRFAIVAALLATTCILWNGSVAQEAKPEEKPAAAASAPDEPGEAAAVSSAAEATEAASTGAPLPDGLNKTLPATSHALDTIWVMIAGFLVMWMQAGFALVECGLTRARTPRTSA